MCVLIVKEKGVALPPEEHLETSHLNNPHGSGIAYYKDGFSKVKIAKGFSNHKQLIKFMTAEGIDESTSCIIHFRFATAGKKISKNNHPFPVTKNKKALSDTRCTTDLAFAHNGTIFEYSNDKKYSDTVLFCMDILSSPVIKNNIDNKIIQSMLKDFSPSSKFAFIKKHIITRLGAFTEEGGVYYSNDSYKNKRFRLLSYNTPTIITNTDCEFCQEKQAFYWRYVDGIAKRCCWKCQQQQILQKVEHTLPCDFCGKHVDIDLLEARQRFSYHKNKYVSAYVCKTCLKSYDSKLIYGGVHGNSGNLQLS